MTAAEVEECLKELRDLAEQYRKEASSSIRQLSLAGLAAVWLFRLGPPSTVGNIELESGLLWPTLFLILALGFDFLFWALGAIYWGLDRRHHLGVRDSEWSRGLMRLLTRIEIVHNVPAVRLRGASTLVSAGIVFTVLGWIALLVFLAGKVLF